MKLAPWAIFCALNVIWVSVPFNAIGAGISDTRLHQKLMELRSDQVKGTVVAVTSDKITVQMPTGPVYDINRTPNTKVSGELKVGSIVTVTCNARDTQKKE